MVLIAFCCSTTNPLISPFSIIVQLKQVELQFTLFDPSIADSETVNAQILEALGLVEPISFSLDLGKIALEALASSVVGGGDRTRRDLQQNDSESPLPISSNGSFLFGESVESKSISEDNDDRSAAYGRIASWAMVSATLGSGFVFGL